MSEVNSMLTPLSTYVKLFVEDNEPFESLIIYRNIVRAPQ